MAFSVSPRMCPSLPSLNLSESIKDSHGRWYQVPICSERVMNCGFEFIFERTRKCVFYKSCILQKALLLDIKNALMDIILEVNASHWDECKRPDVLHVFWPYHVYILSKHGRRLCKNSDK